MSVLDDYSPGEDLRRLAGTDYEAAQLKHGVHAAEYVAKKQRYIEFLSAEGNNEVRKAISESSHAYEEKNEKYLDAILVSEAMQNERKTCQLRIDVWRSLNANRRQAQ